MTGKRSGGEPDDRDTDSWASEAVPLDLRKEMLERELKKLGFRKAGVASAPAHDGPVARQQQQQPQGEGHPHADDEGGEHSE